MTNIIELFIEDLGKVTGGVGPKGTETPSSSPNKEEGGHTMSVGEGGGGGSTDCFPRIGDLK